MNGLLLTSNQDIEILNNNNNLTGIACFYTIIQMNESIELDYFFESCMDNIDDSLVGELAANWYRDNIGRDVVSKHEVMLGAVLQTHLTIKLSNVVRYYFAFKQYLDKYKKLIVSEKIPEDLNLVAQLFANKIDFFHSDNSHELHTSEATEVKIEPPPVHKYFSKPLRFFQNFITKYLCNKVLVVNDWTFKKVENPDCLNINKFNPLHTFCLTKSEKYLEQAKINFQKELDFELIRNNIYRVLGAFNFNNEVENDLATLCIYVIDKEYEASRDNLIRTYCSYREMFSYYSPSMIIVPGSAHSFYQTIYGIAKSKKIPTLMIQDGYNFYFDKYHFPKDKNGKVQMFDYCAVMGSDVDRVYKNVFHGLPIKTLKISPPIISIHKSSDLRIERNKAIIMFPHGMIYKPSCMDDQRYKYVFEVIEVLISLGFLEIQIKIKDGGSQEGRHTELKFMKYLIDKFNHSNVEFIFGELFEYLPDSRIIVGYLGTAIIESVHAKVPFYVYEPKTLGMSDDFIRNAVILNENQISRSVTDLRSAIINKEYIELDEDDIYDGIHLQNIDYLKIIKDFRV